MASTWCTRYRPIVTRRYFVLAAAVLLAPIVILPLKNHRWIHYETGRVSLEEVRAMATGGWKIDRFQVVPGIRLVGLVRPPQGNEQPWILYFQGNSHNQLHDAQNYLNRLRGTRDYGLAVWASRGYDASDGSPGAAAFHSDALAVHRRLSQAYGVPREHIHIVGFSMGAETAVSLAADLAKLGTPPPSVAVLSSYNPGHSMLPRVWYSRWIPMPDWYDPVQRIREIRSPVLVIQGTEDYARPVEQARDFATRLGSWGTFLAVPGGHVGPIDDPKSQATMRAFIDAHAGPSRQAS